MSPPEQPAKTPSNTKSSKGGGNTKNNDVGETGIIFGNIRSFFKGRLSKLRAKTFGGIAGVLLLLAGFSFNRHAPAWFAILLLFFGGCWLAITVWQIAVNFHKTNTVAYICSGIVFLAFVGVAGVNWHFEYPNIPTPPNTSAEKQRREAQTQQAWQPPEIPEGATRALVTLGGMPTVAFWLDRPITDVAIISVDGYDPVSARIENRRLYVSADIALPSGASLKVDKMQLKGDIPIRCQRNYSSNAFEIVGPDQLPLFQEFYRAPEHVVVWGVFSAPNNTKITNGVIVAFDGILAVDVPWTEAEQLMKGKRKAIFKYPAYQHPGEYADK